MKKNMKKSIMIFGVFAITLVIITNTTATNVIQEELKRNMKKDVYVEPNIILTKIYLPILRNSIKQIQEPDYKNIVQQIVDLIEKEGRATSQDIKKIVDSSDANIKNVFLLGIVYGDGPGRVLCFPFTYLKCLPVLGLFTFYLPTLVTSWEANSKGNNPPPDKPTTINVKGHTYTRSNHDGGLAIGFIGLSMNSGINLITNPGYCWTDITLLGFFVILFIN
jgi:hypothetical protein